MGVIKAIRTQRGAYEAYGEDFGIDFNRLLQAEAGKRSRIS